MADVLEAANARRRVLGLPALTELTADTKVDAGRGETAKTQEFNKESALRDLKALADAAKGFPELGNTAAASIAANLATLEADPALFEALQRRSLIEKGLALVDGPECPLCDTAWDDEKKLRDHLKAKLVKSDEAQKLQAALLKDEQAIADRATRTTGLLAPVQKIAEARADEDFAKLVSAWKADLESVSNRS